MTWNIGTYQNNGWDIGSWQDSYLLLPSSFGATSHYTFVNKTTHFFNNITGTIYLWDFGDGCSSDSFLPTHIYCKAGTYTLRLYVDGVLYIDSHKVIVLENDYILDAGVVYVNYDEDNCHILGTTEGGNLFGIEQDIRYMTFDGTIGSQLAGAHRIIGSTPKIVANIIEINYQLLNKILPGSNLCFSSGYLNIQRSIRKLLESDYIKNIALVAQHGPTGAFIVFKILNAITLESMEIPFEDSNESVIECTFAGCFSPDNLIDEPWEIDFIQ